ncbi:hypothetical protein Tco_0725067 [Tanacetum coccineum]|uniref:Uncharacterized protein n=1 Tax=Tanacetum coccineum TaxID=301880 RepID=A0ABQ4YCW4_9ASTR
MHEDYEYVKSLEKEVDELESEKADFSNIYDLLLEECVSKDVTCSYLHSLSDLNAYAELQCLYLHKVKECECLAQKLSKQTESWKSTLFCEDHRGNDLLTVIVDPDLYTISLPRHILQQLQSVSWLKLHQLNHGLHQRLSPHLNFGLTSPYSQRKEYWRTGLPKLKYVKDQLCSSCDMKKLI